MCRFFDDSTFLGRQIVSPQAVSIPSLGLAVRGTRATLSARASNVTSSISSLPTSFPRTNCPCLRESCSWAWRTRRLGEQGRGAGPSHQGCHSVTALLGKNTWRFKKTEEFLFVCFESIKCNYSFTPSLPSEEIKT